MEIEKVCWKITTKCNQNCKYCFGFVDIPELSFEDNKQVLSNLVDNGLKKITWTGGEAILYPQLDKLIKQAKEAGVQSKLITNGIFLANNDNEYTNEVLENLDSLTLSIDSISNNINTNLGKIDNHYEIVKTVLDKAQKIGLKVNINTVVTTGNIQHLEELGTFLNQYQIYKWKLLDFMPIREKSLLNKDKLQVENIDIDKKIVELNHFTNIKNIIHKNQESLEKDFVVLPNGDIIKTCNSIDIKFTNALLLNKRRKSIMGKIRTFIALNDGNMDTVTNLLKELNFVDLIGTSNNGKDAVNEIINLKPQVVFADYRLDGLNGLEVIKFSSEKLENNIPSYNIITNENLNEKTEEIIKLVGNKFNSIIEENDTKKIVDVIEEYNNNI